MTNACGLICRFLRLSPQHPPSCPPSPRDTNRNSHPFVKTTPGQNYPFVLCPIFARCRTRKPEWEKSTDKNSSWGVDTRKSDIELLHISQTALQKTMMNTLADHCEGQSRVRSGWVEALRLQWSFPVTVCFICYLLLREEKARR